MAFAQLKIKIRPSLVDWPHPLIPLLWRGTINIVVNKINFATKIYRLSPLEKGGNEVSSREFFCFTFLEFNLSLSKEQKKEHYNLFMQRFLMIYGKYFAFIFWKTFQGPLFASIYKSWADLRYVANFMYVTCWCFGLK